MGPVAAPTGRTFAAVALTWKAAAPFRPRLVAALCRRVAALRASGVDVTVLGPGGVVPAGLLRECRLVRGTPEVMRVMVAALARRGVGPGLLLLVGSEFGGPGGRPGERFRLSRPGHRQHDVQGRAAQRAGGQHRPDAPGPGQAG